MRPTSASPRRPNSPFRPRVEHLEDRVTPVLDPYAPVPVPGGFVTDDGVPLDGVVQLNWMTTEGRTGTASGAFLGDDERRGPTDAMTQLTRAGNAQYILTAAHVLTNEAGVVDVPTLTVSFYLPSRADPFTFTVTSDQYRIHPAWNGNSRAGNDIALIDLREIGPVGPNGIGATPYAINTVTDEVRKQFEFAGFGNTGNGTDGQVRGTTGVKRLGYNVFDVTFGNQVAYDYDSGDPWDNTLFWAGSAQTPVKSHDSFGGQGDSGGPAFLYDAVAGISSWVLGESDPPDHDFGDIGFMERISTHRDWIRGHLNVPRGVTLNMANQPFGNDGRTDRIEVRREDSRVAVYVNGYVWVDLPSAGLNSFTLLGSGDSENISIDSGLREAVTVDGGGGTNRLYVTNSPSTLTYTVDAARVNCVSLGLWQTTIDYWNLSGIEVIADAADRARVYAVRAGTPVTVTGAGTVDVGVRGTGTLGSIADAVTVNGNGSTTLFINDDAWTAPRRYALSANQLDVDRFTSTWTTINFGGLTVLELHGGSGGNSTTVTNTPAIITRLYTGSGVDTTNVLGTSGGVLAVEGQAGNDTVNLGSNGRVQAVGGSVRIRNAGGFTTVNADNSNDARAKTVTMQAVADGHISITGLTPGTVRVARDAVRRLNLWTGAGNDTFNINDTPDNFAPLSFGTTIRSGGGNDFFNVNGTSGWLAIETGGGKDNLVRVGNNADGLNRISGEVSVDGAGGTTTLSVNDASSVATPTNPFYSYVVAGDVVRRVDRAGVNHRNLSTLTLTTSQATDIVNVLGTIPDVAGGRGTTVLTGDGDDFVDVRGSQSYLRVDVGNGFGNNVTAGDKLSSLDAIRGSVDVSGGFFTVTISNEASTIRQSAVVTRSTLFGQPAQTVTRQELRNGENVVLNTFNVLATGKANVTYLAGQGGDSLFANGTQANVATTLVGSPFATEVLAVGFGSDTRQILGQVTLRGQAANNDVAYYYDFLSPTKQSYGVYGFQAGDQPDLYVTQRGIAPVEFIGFGGVSFYAPVVGESKIDVFGTPQGTQLGIVAGNGDFITVGSNGSALNGTVDTIRGHLFVATGNATLVVDDSGSKTAREARLSTSDFLGTTYGQIDGLAPGGISFVDRPDWNVDVQLGGQNDYFLMSGDPLATRVRIDGGAGNDVLVGSGGNVLRGGKGHDLLIAGSTASFLYGDDLTTNEDAGQDILIGGTTVHSTDRAQLDAIMAVWTSAAEYETRVATLRGGLLGAGTVTGNGGGNTMYGVWDRDFFLGTPLDDTDWQDDEQFVPL